MNHETAGAQMQRITAEARRLYQNDMRSRRIAESAVRDAMEGCPQSSEPQDVHDIALKAVMTALAMVYDQDSELNIARAERDHYKKIATDIAFLSPRSMVISAQGIPLREDGEAG